MNDQTISKNLLAYWYHPIRHNYTNKPVTELTCHSIYDYIRNNTYEQFIFSEKNATNEQIKRLIYGFNQKQLTEEALYDKHIPLKMYHNLKRRQQTVIYLFNNKQYDELNQLFEQIYIESINNLIDDLTNEIISQYHDYNKAVSPNEKNIRI